MVPTTNRVAGALAVSIISMIMILATSAAAHLLHMVGLEPSPWIFFAVCMAWFLHGGFARMKEDVDRFSTKHSILYLAGTIGFMALVSGASVATAWLLWWP